MCHRLNHRLVGHNVVCGGERIAVMEIYLVLSRTLLVMRALRGYAHLFKMQANLSPDVLALVLGGDIHIACVVVGYRCGVIVLVELEKVKLQSRAERELYALFFCILNGFYEQTSCVALKSLS